MKPNESILNSIEWNDKKMIHSNWLRIMKAKHENIQRRENQQTHGGKWNHSNNKRDKSLHNISMAYVSFLDVVYINLWWNDDNTLATFKISLVGSKGAKPYETETHRAREWKRTNEHKLKHLSIGVRCVIFTTTTHYTTTTTIEKKKPLHKIKCASLINRSSAFQLHILYSMCKMFNRDQNS